MRRVLAGFAMTEELITAKAATIKACVCEAIAARLRLCRAL
jgi:hypothetical protein